jgi:hypothetical protein
MSFTIDGVWLGRPVCLSWSNGVLVGPAGLSDLIRYHAYLRRHGLGPPLLSASGRRHDHDALGDHDGAILLIHQLLDRVDRVVASDVAEEDLAASAGAGTRVELVQDRHLRLV